MGDVPREFGKARQGAPEETCGLDAGVGVGRAENAPERLTALVEKRDDDGIDVTGLAHGFERVLEFGRLPEFAGMRLGKKLMDATMEDARRKGFSRLEYWSQDRGAQRFYRRLGLKEIGRHYRFRIKAPRDVADRMMQDYVGIEYLYCACTVEEWPLVKQKYEVIARPPLEPHLCVGFETRF